MNDSINEQIYQSKLHWIIFSKPILLLLFPLVFSFVLGFQLHVFAAFSVIAIGWGIAEWVRYLYTTLSIKPRGIVLQTGFWVQQTIDLPMRRIESIDVTQTLFGTLFNFGNIIITGSGGTRQVIGPIDNPLTTRRYIEQYLHSES
jgi:uncharacterized membrane protein YdbT with pleckstrin-like domain